MLNRFLFFVCVFLRLLIVFFQIKLAETLSCLTMLPNQKERVRANLLKSPHKSTVGGKRKSNLSSKAIKFAAGGYMICSSLMLITNKLAVHNLPAPQFVLFSQLFTSGIYINTSSQSTSHHITSHYILSIGMFYFRQSEYCQSGSFGMEKDSTIHTRMCCLPRHNLL